jgi:hypothetical protein
MVKRRKPRLTFTLSKRQIKILEKCGGRNKSEWLGERIEEWYELNIEPYDRLTNEIKWTQVRKMELEERLWSLHNSRERLSGNEIEK